MYGAGAVNALDIGGNDWRPPAPAGAVTTDTLLDLVEAARLSPGPAAVTSEDADFVRRLGLGACNLPAAHGSTSIRQRPRGGSSLQGPASTGRSFQSGLIAAAAPAAAAASRSLAHATVSGSQGRQRPLRGSSHLPAPSGRSASPIRGAATARGLGAPAPSTGGRRLVISEATASAMHAMLGGEAQLRLSAESSAPLRPQGAGTERGCALVAAGLLADHLGLVGSDASRLSVVLDSFGALSGGGVVPHHLGAAQYASWVARSDEGASVWHAAVRCALAPLAELPPGSC